MILDTGVLIALERGSLSIDEVLGQDDGAIAAVTAMELLVGVARSDAGRRAVRSRHIEALLASLSIEAYTMGVARVHAELAAEAMAAGRSRSWPDMMIAATSRHTDRVLLTTDASAGFAELTGVRAEVIEATERLS